MNNGVEIPLSNGIYRKDVGERERGKSNCSAIKTVGHCLLATLSVAIKGGVECVGMDFSSVPLFCSVTQIATAHTPGELDNDKWIGSHHQVHSKNQNRRIEIMASVGIFLL